MLRPRDSKSSNINDEFLKNGSGQFSVDLWVLNDIDYNYGTQLTSEMLEKANGEVESNKLSWSKFMIGAKVGEKRLILAHNNGSLLEEKKQGDNVPFYLALEVKLVDVFVVESTTNQQISGQKYVNEEKSKP